MPLPTHPSNRIAEHFQTAYTHHRAGRLDRAADLYQKILRKNPDHADALHLLGLIALASGQPKQAVQLIGKAVAAAPSFADAHSNLGNALMAVGRTGEAIASYQRAIALKPGRAAPYSNLGRAQNSMGAFAAARESCRAAIALAPMLPEPHYNLALALRALGQVVEAKAACRAALHLRPDAPWQRECAALLADLDCGEEALAILDRLLAVSPDEAASHTARASILYRMGDISGSAVAYRRAASLAPNDADCWNGLGRTERAQGRFDAATLAFRRALAIAPEHADAHRNLALLGELGIRSAEAKGLATLIDRRGTADMDRVAAGFALGKLLDDADRYDEAFARYSAANQLFREMQAVAGKRFNRVALAGEVDNAIATYPGSRLAELAEGSSTSDLPVFIVGMPRSGTSLVEQIAASHPQVFGAGELREVGRMAAVLNKQDASQSWDAAEARRLGEAHLAMLRRLGGAALRVIDKMPDNVFLLGHIATLFPRARIIFCRRDPRDTCLSCYFTLFMSGNLFSYDLADCASRHIETDRLMAHWQSVLPLAILTVDYEAVVADLERESRRIIDFLGLRWDPTCLDFHRTERTVVTASSWQVRQPLYRHAVGRWRHYSRHLGALADLQGVDN